MQVKVIGINNIHLVAESDSDRVILESMAKREFAFLSTSNGDTGLRLAVDSMDKHQIIEVLEKEADEGIAKKIGLNDKE